MALIVKDRVRETSTTTGTGTLTLLGAVSAYQSFSVVGDGNTCYYCIVMGAAWEVGLGTYGSSGATLARTSVQASSNAGALVNFSAGTKDVFLTQPATSPAFVTPLLGTPTSGVLTNCTGLPTAGLVDGAVTAVKMVNAGVFTGDATSTFPAITVAAASDTVAGKIEIAVQSEMETGTDTTRAVVAGRQHYHPSAAKAWVNWTVSGGTPTIQASYGVSSLTDTGVGQVTVNFTTAFSSANYCWTVGGSTLTTDSRWGWHSSSAPVAGSIRIHTVNSAQTDTDATRFCAAFFGDQ